MNEGAHIFVNALILRISGAGGNGRTALSADTECNALLDLFLLLGEGQYCLAGVLSMPPRTESDSNAFEPMENGMEMADNSAGGALESEYGYSTTSGEWKTVTAGVITVTIPLDWEWAKLDINGDWGDHIALSHGENHFIIGYYPNFAVCGTGLDQQTVTIADMEARVGTYDDKSMWDFIVFPGDWVALNESGENWTEEEKSEIISILESMTIDKEG